MPNAYCQCDIQRLHKYGVWKLANISHCITIDSTLQ
jgi:hypothetical protein